MIGYRGSKVRAQSDQPLADKPKGLSLLLLQGPRKKDIRRVPFIDPLQLSLECESARVVFVPGRVVAEMQAVGLRVPE